MPSTTKVRRALRRPTVPARYRCAPPTQRRGHETLERFAEAAEELLRERAFEDIGVHDIVRRAGRPIGSFYARFGSKEALLPYLYQRYHDGLESMVAASFSGGSWERLGYHETLAAVVDALLEPYSERRWLIRALAIFARQRPEALPLDVAVRRKAVLAPPLARLLRFRDRIRHADPEAAVRFGIFFVTSTAREKLLFPEAPNARATPMTRAALRDELVRALGSYLSHEAPR
jgi:AcrR family transcriptional regulator